MPRRFATGTDYSQTFSHLVRENQASLEAAARRVDAQREAELAAQDSLVFTRWQEGKISGAQLMAHINKRMRETSFDRAQQTKWREAAVQYGSIIADEKAEAKYARDNNINALIAHYAQRLGNAKRGTPERTELAERVKALRQQRDADNLRKQAKKISRAIERGDMSTRDLIGFYREQLQTLPKGSPLREQVRDTLVDLRNRLRDEEFQIAMQKVDTDLASGHTSPQDAARAKVDILKKFEIEKRDPVNFWKWQEQVRQLRATPDPAEIQQVEFDLIAGNIAPEQYVEKINEWADRIAPFDITAAWELRTEAQKFLEDNATPLADPEALGLPPGAGPGFTAEQRGAVGGGSRGFTGTVEVVRRLRGNAIKHITQLDGSKYSQLNCTMASGAMLAHAMGFTGLTGADLRYLTGDTAGGTTLAQLQVALGKAGVDNTRLSWDDRIGFQQFKQRVANGAPAVLSGWLGDVPSQFNASGITAGHGMFVAGYDAKRDAFLMLDPAKSKDSGTWWPASVVQDFGWGGQRHGQALFAPRGTVDPKTLKRAGGKVRHISVNAKPTMPGTPPTAGGQFDPGPDINNKLDRAAKQELQKTKQRLQDAGITVDKNLDTKQEVEALIDDRGVQIADLEAVVDEYITLAERDPDGDIALLSTGEVMLPEDIAELQRQLIFLYDGQELLYKSIGQKQKAREARSSKNGVLSNAAVINSIEAGWLTNAAVRDANRALENLPEATTRDEIRAVIEEALEHVGTIAAINDDSQDDVTEEPGTQAQEQAARAETVVTPEVEAQLGDWDRVFDVLTGEFATPDERSDAMSELVTELGLDLTDPDDPVAQMLLTLTQKTVEQDALEAGEGQLIMIGGRLEVLPTKETRVTNPETGQLEDAIVLDLGATPPELQEYVQELGYDADTLPKVMLPSADGVDTIAAIPEQTIYEGVNFLLWGANAGNDTGRAVLEQLGLGGIIGDIQSGRPLGEDQIAQLSQPGLIQTLRENDILEEAPFIVEALRFNDEVYYKDTVFGEDGSVTTRWHKDNLPFIGRAPDTLDSGLFGHQYFGADVQPNGSLWPTLNADDMDPSDVGTTAPAFGVSPPKAATERANLVNLGLLPAETRSRNPEDPTGSVIDLPGTPGHFANGQTVSLEAMLDNLSRGHQSAMDKMTSTMSADDAAESAFWTEAEQRQRAQLMGIDYDTGEWIAGPFSAVPDQPPGQQVLQDLGITGGPDPAPVPTAGFDPQEAIDSARSVADRNRAEREAKAAAREAAAQTQRSSLPKITPKPAPKLPTGPSPTPRPTPRMTPSPTPSRPKPPPPPSPRPPGGSPDLQAILESQL